MPVLICTHLLWSNGFVNLLGTVYSDEGVSTKWLFIKTRSNVLTLGLTYTAKIQLTVVVTKNTGRFKLSLICLNDARGKQRATVCSVWFIKSIEHEGRPKLPQPTWASHLSSWQREPEGHKAGSLMMTGICSKFWENHQTNKSCFYFSLQLVGQTPGWELEQLFYYVGVTRREVWDDVRLH